MDKAEQVVYELWVILGDLCIAPGASGDKKTHATDCVRQALADSGRERKEFGLAVHPVQRATVVENSP